MMHHETTITNDRDTISAVSLEPAEKEQHTSSNIEELCIL